MTTMNTELAERVSGLPTPCYVYDTAAIARRASELRAALGKRFALSFAVKSNPNLGLLDKLREDVDYLDVSSGGEIGLALAAGWSGTQLSFTGPGKLDRELELSLEVPIAEVVLESLWEARRLSEFAAHRGRDCDVLVRLAPARIPKGFGLNLAGKPTQFGIEEARMEADLSAIRKLPRLNVKGFHIYSGTQCLDAGSLAENYEIYLDVFQRACTLMELAPRKLVFGSGLGIPYHAGDVPIELPRVAERICPQLDRLRQTPGFAECQFILELGRYLVGEAGWFLTRIIHVKESRGTRICICDGGMNNHLAASGQFGTVIHRNYPVHKVGDQAPGTSCEYDLVGPLCTTIDILARRVTLPRLQDGDMISIGASGAYGLTASPLYFISHNPPREFLASRDRSNTLSIRDVTQYSGVREALDRTHAAVVPANSERGIIIVGVPRSGTTLLRRLLDAHPDIDCPAETGLLAAAARFLQSDRLVDNLDVGVLTGLSMIGVEEGDVLSRLRELVLSFHREHARKAGKRRWAIKTAFDSFYLEKIRRLIGGHAQYVCIIRHGLDVVCSLQELCTTNGTYLSELHEYIKRFPCPLEAFAHVWVDLTNQILDFCESTPQLSLLLKYEELVGDPTRHLQAVLEQLGESWQSDLVANALGDRGNMGLGDWKTYGRKEIDSQSIGRWKHLSAPAIASLAEIVNPTLERCGYEPLEIPRVGNAEHARRRYLLGLMLGGLTGAQSTRDGRTSAPPDGR